MPGLQKTGARTMRFMSGALAWRSPDRQYALVAWCLIAGMASLAISLPGEPAWLATALAGLYLLAVLAAICAIDAGYGIIPNGLVVALAAGGVIQSMMPEQSNLVLRSAEAASFFVVACLFRKAYHFARGIDGLGFGDVKFATAGVLWIGIEAVPGMLLIAVASALATLVILKTEGYRLTGKQAISFGPHLAIGLWLSWILGPLQFSF
jgi:leader peptidase (prepilin peptidase) / N-methyltransferase